MIKTRLVGLLSHAKKYIIYQVIWQWFALLCQIAMIYCASVFAGTGAVPDGDAGDGSILRRDCACGGCSCGLPVTGRHPIHPAAQVWM